MKNITYTHLSAEEFNNLVNTHFPEVCHESYNYFECEDFEKKYGHYIDVQTFKANKTWTEEDEVTWMDAVAAHDTMHIADLLLKKLVIDNVLPEGDYLIGDD